MKKIISIVLMIVLLLFMIFRTYFSGTNTINVSSKLKIIVPKYIFLVEKTEEQITMKTIRSYNNTKKEMDSILKNYNIVNCNNKTYYYNELQDYTIIKYEISDYIILNSITIKYQLGNYCNEINS